MRYFMYSLLLCGLTACTTITPPRQQTATLATSYDHTYACAVQSMISMGGVDIKSDKQGGIVSCTMHGAVALTARITPITGVLMNGITHLEVTGTLLPNKIVVGSMNEVEHYVAKVKECQ